MTPTNARQANAQNRQTFGGASHIFWLGSYNAAIPSIDDFGPTVNFEAAFVGEQGIGFGFRPAASRPTKKWDAPNIRAVGNQSRQTL